MVRADILDGIDDVLRRYRDGSRPFGGVQLLMIGDLHQLPPVAQEDEWNLLRNYYDTCYFFSSKALAASNPVTIELKHIYRQSDDTFIRLLNKVRDNETDPATLELLNSRYRPDFYPRDEDAYITLTAHNASAQAINQEKLALLPGTPVVYQAEIANDFPVSSYPNDETLELKVGAQVMFVKNDLSRERLYYNGKIGQITEIEGHVIRVKCSNEPGTIEVVRATWENIKYTLNENTKEVQEEILGTFTQYPLRLAWAITIHKSQGLTFERAIIDAQAAFAHGQVYVALSRCKSFEGIVLRSKIGVSSVKTDQNVRQYTAEADRNAPDEAHLLQSKVAFQQSLLFELFAMRALRRFFEQMTRILSDYEKNFVGAPYERFRELHTRTTETVFSIADRFLPVLRGYFSETEQPETQEALLTRLKDAGAYFVKNMEDLLPALKNLQLVTDNKEVERKTRIALENLQKEVFVTVACMKILQAGFSAQGCLRAKSDAALDFARTLNAQAANALPHIPSNVAHPMLYAELLRWRNDLASEHEVDPYTILPVKAMTELVQLLPTTPKALKRIKGLGAVKSGKYGSEIVEIISKYCKKNLSVEK
jgi:hypothetical protein